MNVIPPLTITDAMLTSSTVVETAPTAWSGATTYALDNTASVAGAAGLITIYKSLQNTNLNHAPASSPTWWVNIGTTYQVYSGAATYALGDMVIDATKHLVYESLAAGNLGNALTDTTKWLLIGPTNKWAMFDLLRNTTSAVPHGSLTVVLTPGVRVDSICLAGMVGVTSARVQVVVSAVTVYDYTADLNLREVFDWYDYYFNPFSTRPTLALFDLPPYSTAVITITLTGSGSIECGACVPGSYQYIGNVGYEAESDVLNFSTVTRDFAGNTAVMVQRRNVPRTIQQISVSKTRLNSIRSLRDSLSGSPAVWSALDDDIDDYFDSFLIIGFYKKFSINAKHPDTAIISLELEEI